MPATGYVSGAQQVPAGLSGHWITEDGTLRCHLAVDHQPVLWTQHLVLIVLCLI